MAQETQYCNLRYILGTVYSGNTEASEISPADGQYGLFGSVLGLFGRFTNCSALDHVADCESLYRLVLGGASRAVGASDRLDVATALLVTSAASNMLAPAPRLDISNHRCMIRIGRTRGTGHHTWTRAS